MQAVVRSTRMRLRSRPQLRKEKLISPPSQKAAESVSTSTLGRNSRLRHERRGARRKGLAKVSIAMALPVGGIVGPPSIDEHTRAPAGTHRSRPHNYTTV